MNVVRVAHQAAVHHIAGPHIDWTALSPLIVLTAGGLLVLLVGLLRPALVREWIVPGLTVLTFLGAVAAAIVVFDHHPTGKAGFCVVAAPGCGSAPLAMDRLALELYMLFSVAGVATVLMSWRGIAIRESGHGEWGGLLIFSVLGMCVFVSAQNLITLFLGIELLSIPLYILCASETRREGSLESGLKYLIVGSVGSATLVYGLGLIYGATGSTDFATIGSALSQGKLAGGGTAMVFTGLALTIVGFAFKASVAPFHQWTPDVYEGAPTAITAFMATATKAAALGAFLRFFDVAAIGAQHTWAPMLATVAAITIVVGNVGALGQSSLKRMMGYSGVGQAGYMLSGVVVGSRLGIQATVLYLIAYLFMNLAPFAVIVAEEHERPDGDYLSGLAGLGTHRPWLAWPMTIGMLGLAGIPGTVGFIGKFQLINALVSGAYTWLAIVLVIGSMISLGYYLRVVATIWMRPPVAAPSPAAAATGPGELAPIAGGSPDADEWEEGPGSAGAALAYPELVFVAVAFATAVIFFGIFPSPLFNFTAHAASALSGLF
ncbi:MAG: NADH-quinone oxidoreductase subunit N [Solirubrobacterales bacterium]|nr:NADH-quinone oxidoreductase subunit N [Solirubrobacterales bacterium]